MRDESMNQGGYAVGYGKPPRQSRFKRGQSGNPKGRPKGTFNTATLLNRIIRERVVINENGRRMQISMFEAVLKQLTTKAAKGDLRAISQLIGTVLTIEKGASEEATPQKVLHEVDQKIMLRFLKRHKQSSGKGEDDGN